ncbi:MAG TPA: polyamine ABC transporter substrate-binding protein [Steroidobacteraceae bacterium]|jgi:putrescine transport system substrate-binding protein|nr:polyamine ABC transporter substrate-binding protein [Steroidobacteraceae bacterium]
MRTTPDGGWRMRRTECARRRVAAPGTHRALGQLGAALWLAAVLSGCGSAAPAGVQTAPAATQAGATDPEKVLNVYNWSDYIDPSVVPAFEKEYGIKVNYDVFDSNEVLETKLLAGSTGYDVVVPSASFLQRQIQAGVFQKLDKALLPNLKNLDPAITHAIEVNDPGNQYGVNYLWGTSGVGYNVDKVAAAMPAAPVDSFAMLFDPAVVQHFKACGVSILDAPDEVVGEVLVYLGRDPNSEAPQDLAAAEKVLLSVRPYIRYINSSKYIEDLANGEICLALGWSGDVEQARVRAQHAGNGVKIRYGIAREGGMSFFDMLAIPTDAPHPRNAHLFINYLLRPDVAAKNSTAEHYATGNRAAYGLLPADVYEDPGIYPTPSELARLHPNAAHGQTYTRELNRVWTHFKTGT